MAHGALVYRGARSVPSSVGLLGSNPEYQFNGLDIGPPGLNRYIMIGLVIKQTGGYTPTLRYFDVVSGTSLQFTQYIFQHWNYSGIVASLSLHWIAIPSSVTTIDLSVAITPSANSTYAAMCWWTFRPQSSTVLDYNYGGNLTSVYSYGSINLPTKGIIFGMNMHLDALTSITTSATGAQFDLNSLNTPVSDSELSFASHTLRNDTAISYPSFTGTFPATSTQMYLVGAFGPQVTVGVSASEAFGMAQTSNGTKWTNGITLAQGVNIGNFALHTMPQYLSDTLTENTGVSNTYVIRTSITQNEATLLLEQYGSKQFGQLDTNFTMWGGAFFDRVAVAADTINVGDALAYIFKLGPVISEGAKVADTLNPNFKYYAVITERPNVKDVMIIAVPATLTQAVQVTQVTQTARGLSVIEKLGLADALGVASKLRPTVQEYVTLSDALRRFFGGAVVEGIGVTDLTARSKTVNNAVAEAVGVNDALTRKLVFRVTSENGIGLDDIDVLKMYFRPSLAEGFEIAAAYISPGQSVTTWTTNVRNMATTEYTNFNFNSFAQIGRKYLGATSSGLYELNGDDDAGTDIIAQIKSGFAQFSGSRFTSFKAAYLGMKGSGEFVLKVETGDGKTYVYGVSAKDMQTTRVHFGKGLRARYFAFELISTGQDFDLDDIEFLPLVAQRRV